MIIIIIKEKNNNNNNKNSAAAASLSVKISKITKEKHNDIFVYLARNTLKLSQTD